MESLDLWRLCDEMSISQAALLITGADPSDFLGPMRYDENLPIKNFPAGYEAAVTALENAVRAGTIDARIVPYEEYCREIEQYGPVEGSICIKNTTISVSSLKRYLSDRGFRNNFFFPNNLASRPEYLNTEHPNYSPKLAAAIEAWMAVTENPDMARAKSIKQAVTIWLRSNAGRFDLIKDDGNPNESGIEEVAKVVNWGTKGGAPTTPAD